MNIERVKKDAKRLLKLVRACTPDAIARCTRACPGLVERWGTQGRPPCHADMLHVLAIEHGFRSWRDLLANVGSVSREA